MRPLRAMRLDTSPATPAVESYAEHVVLLQLGNECIFQAVDTLREARALRLQRAPHLVQGEGNHARNTGGGGGIRNERVK